MILNRLAGLFFRGGSRGEITPIAAGRSDIGRLRKNNEDSLLIAEEIGLYLVSDGMGGHRGGETASKCAADTIAAEIRAGKTLKDSLLAAHREIAGLGTGKEDTHSRPGSTVVALLLTCNSWQLCWVGDSRGWLLHKGNLQQLSVDHTVVQQMVNWGDISEKEALTHPDRNQLSQALGSRDVPPVVGCVDGRLERGMRFLLATDGMALWNEPGKLAEILGSGDGNTVVDRLIELSLAEGGRDNVSCVVVSC
ncbi:PP2C family protein-serine/threonine phosphatase [Desulfomarina sp.]